MAAKKKTKKKKTTAKKTAGKKIVSLKKKAKNAPKKASAKTNAQKAVAAKAAKKSKKKAPGKKKNFETLEFPRSRPKDRTLQQSGDFQGLSRSEDANSESVEELLEEGNTFEAGVVSGVEEADDADESEVHTHEVPEDDVPEEYLDKDE
jgi:hypothetical protein